ncbi:hypothetical protein PINS_up004227 [Pythium insidiosum]|nr:hypothetical protein PINS_up004227 [Pythium insidiosum]
MPYQVLPGIVIISAAFTLMGVGFGAVNKWQARREHQVRSLCLARSAERRNMAWG